MQVILSYSVRSIMLASMIYRQQRSAMTLCLMLHLPLEMKSEQRLVCVSVIDIVIIGILNHIIRSLTEVCN